MIWIRNVRKNNLPKWHAAEFLPSDKHIIYQDTLKFYVLPQLVCRWWNQMK